MWRKRKATSVSSHNTDDSRRKRWKSHFVVSSSDGEDEDQDQDQDQESENDEGEWDIKCILEESEDQYLIGWEGPYSPTWVSRNGEFICIVSNIARTGTKGQRQRRCNQSLGR